MRRRILIVAVLLTTLLMLGQGVSGADVQTNIPRTVLNGERMFSFPATTASFMNATITIDRTDGGLGDGLNSLPTTATLGLVFNYSTDGGSTWLNVAGVTLPGGTYVTKGVTQTTDILGIGIGHPFPVGTLFEVDTVASQQVAIQGNVVYS